MTAPLRLAGFGLDCRWVSAPLDTSWTHSVGLGSAFCVRARTLVHCTSVHWSFSLQHGRTVCSSLSHSGKGRPRFGWAAQIGYRLQLVAPDYWWKQLHITGGNVLQSAATVVRTQDRRGLVSYVFCSGRSCGQCVARPSFHPLLLQLFKLASRRSEMGVHGAQRGSEGVWEAWEALIFSGASAHVILFFFFLCQTLAAMRKVGFAAKRVTLLSVSLLCTLRLRKLAFAHYSRAMQKLKMNRMKNLHK